MRTAILSPTYGDYPQGFINSLMNLLPRGQYYIVSPGGGSNVTSIRNTCFQQMLIEEQKSGKFDKILFIDCDILFKPEDAEKILSYDKDVVSGVYFKKSPPYEPVAGYYDVSRIHNGFPAVEKKIIISKQTVEVDWVGMGFVAMKRNILDKIEYPWFDMKVIDLPKPEKRDGNLVITKEILSEDISFWTKVKELGYKLWLDTSVTVKHIGKTNYSIDHFLAM